MIIESSFDGAVSSPESYYVRADGVYMVEVVRGTCVYYSESARGTAVPIIGGYDSALKETGIEYLQNAQNLVVWDTAGNNDSMATSSNAYDRYLIHGLRRNDVLYFSQVFGARLWLVNVHGNDLVFNVRHVARFWGTPAPADNCFTVFSILGLSDNNTLGFTNGDTVTVAVTQAQKCQCANVPEFEVSDVNVQGKILALNLAQNGCFGGLVSNELVVVFAQGTPTGTLKVDLDIVADDGCC